MMHANLAFSRFCFVAIFPLSLAACSSTPPAKSADALSTSSPARPSSSAPSTQRPTAATRVAIDDAILRACQLGADKAYFAFDSANLRSSAVRPLDAVANCFTHGALKGRSVKLVGRADPRGDQEYNLVLGQSRADSVGAALKRDGLSPLRISSTSRGAMDAAGRDEDGWSKDRRVDVLLGS